MVALRNRVARDVLGAVADDTVPEEIHPYLLDQEHDRNIARIAREDGKLVGVAEIFWAVDPESKVTWGEINVVPEYRGRGIGSRLLEEVEAFARELGRPILQGGAYHQQVDGPRLDSPTGYGSLPREEQAVRFLANRGFTLEQVYRYSRLPLPVDPAVIDPLYEAALAKAGPDYRIVTWMRRVPEQWLDGVATIFMRMATDAPAGNLEIDEEKWDADRVRKNDEKRLASGRTQLVAAVEHVPTGSLVAFNGVTLSEDRSRTVHQGITLVLKEHRGHRLGTIVKIANIHQLAAFSPGSPCILTDNAEENRPMLDVNEAVGFQPVGYEGVWKKILT
jgi:GNAT superfamily N-acetyltransferase